MIKISATSMSNFTQCHRKYFYYKTKKFSKSLAFSFGLSFEYGLEEYLKNKSIPISIELAHKHFDTPELKKIVYDDLEIIEKSKGGDITDAIVMDYLQEKTIELIAEHKLLLDDMLPRLINCLEEEQINISQMQLETTLIMENGNTNNVRFDGICEWNGKKYIFELKSYKSFKSYSELKQNTQLLNYVNVLKRKGEDIEGVLFCQVKKSIPEEPRLIKKGKELSTDKSQKCRAEDYYKVACDLYGKDNIPIGVLETYEHLFNKSDLIEVLEIKFTEEELNRFWNQIKQVSIEMDWLSNEISKNPIEAYDKCYQNVGQHCSYCGYKESCWKGEM